MLFATLPKETFIHGKICFQRFLECLAESMFFCHANSLSKSSVHLLKKALIYAKS